MSDKAVVHIGENSPEHVAAKMTEQVLSIIEGKSLSQVTRKEYLDTYAECLSAVKGYRMDSDEGHQ